MAISEEERENLRDLFASLGPIQVRRMFGGAGLYLDDACFALLVNGEVMLRGDETLGPDLEAQGSPRWAYQRPGKDPVQMPYWPLPDSALDDPDEACAWARRALVPARQAAAEKAARKARRPTRATKARTAKD